MRRPRSRRDVSRAAVRRLLERGRKGDTDALLVASDALYELGFAQDGKEMATAAEIIKRAQDRGDPVAIEAAQGAWFRRSFDSAELALAALDWRDVILSGADREHEWVRSKNLQGIRRYLKKAGGSKLVILERAPDGSGVLNIFFNDGATVSTSFASYSVMHGWTKGRAWTKGSRVETVDRRDPRRRRSRVRSRSRR